MRRAVVLGAFLVAASAQAGEPLAFVAPAGWTVDAEKAKAMHAELFAVDERTQPPATMIGMKVDKPSPVPDEALVRGFIAGAKKKAPTLVEVRHDFPEISGVRGARIIADVTLDGEAERQAYYLMQAGDATAILVLSAARDAFDARLPEFDGIAQRTRGLVDFDVVRSERIGELVGRILGMVLIFVALFFGLRFLRRRLNKPSA